MKIAFIYCYHSLSHCGSKDLFDGRVDRVAMQVNSKSSQHLLESRLCKVFIASHLLYIFGVLVVRLYSKDLMNLSTSIRHAHFDVCSFLIGTSAPISESEIFAATKNILQEKNVRAPCTVTLLWGLGGAPHKQLG